jgi:predicted unusual protein kinase regulating ubiquinone biosynthesis (AarF/ABC1/UbiB family)
MKPERTASPGASEVGRGLEWLADLWGIIGHTWTLSVLMAVFIVRYAWVVFRLRVIERPIRRKKLVALNEKTAREYVAAAMRLKGGTIKVGQFISARADIMPKEIVAIMSQLQDRVTAAPFATIEKTLRDQYGGSVDEIFANFEHQAVAAASFGQVHRATTTAGQKVVVKILHRDIERSLRVDLAIFRIAVFFFGRLFPKLQVGRVYDEIADVTLAELDYTREADSAERVRDILANDKRVRVPLVMRAYCRPRVLCLEDITGLRVDDRALIEKSGASPREVMRAIIGAYCQQIYVAGFFQSDPHAGNLFFYPPQKAEGAQAEQPLIGIIDFGQAKEMPQSVHLSLRRAVLAVLKRDPPEFMEALVDLGVIEHAEIGKVQRVVEKLSGEFKTGSVNEVMKLDYATLAKDVFEALRELDSLALPNDLLLYGRVLGLLHGLGFMLDPDLPVFEVAAPYLMKFAFG